MTSKVIGAIPLSAASISVRIVDDTERARDPRGVHLGDQLRCTRPQGLRLFQAHRHPAVHLIGDLWRRHRVPAAFTFAAMYADETLLAVPTSAW